MEKKISRKAGTSESATRTLSQTIVDDESTHYPLHSPSHSDGKSSPPHSLIYSLPTPLALSSPRYSTLKRALVPVDYNYPVKAPPPPHVPSSSSSPPPALDAVRKPRVRRSRSWLDLAALGFRVSVCLISFSVMAADRTDGWSGDSFDRYKEYRYCLSVTVIAFVYAALQACSLSYLLITGKNVIKNHLGHHFQFAIDQILAYLIISASSSAATRVNDWECNWGKDDFTIMATASVTMSFLAFATFAFSSLISGCNLFWGHS